MFFTGIFIKIKTAWEYLVYPSKYYAKKYAKQYSKQYALETVYETSDSYG